MYDMVVLVALRNKRDAAREDTSNNVKQLRDRQLNRDGKTEVRESKARLLELLSEAGFSVSTGSGMKRAGGQ